MGTRSILIVGFELPWPNAEYVPFRSRRSLLDGDIIVIKPNITSLFHAPEEYNGKPCYNDSDSFEIREHISHWRSEIISAFNAGKTIVVLLMAQQDFHIATGEKEYSGTGRNSRTKRIVEPVNNYSIIPITLKELKNSTGSKIRKEKDLRPLQSYWSGIESMSRYMVTFDSEKVRPLLFTSDGSKVVGALVRSKGNMVLVPDLVIDPDDLFAEDIDDDGNDIWADSSNKLAARLEAAFVGIDKECKSDRETTAPPDWISALEFRLPSETQYEARIVAASEKIQTLQKEHQEAVEDLDRHKAIKNLLFEKGKPLEAAVILALTELGYEVANYSDGEREFDAIFTADGVRLLGEIEGKDDRAINVDKISQLERNIGEDFERDEVSEHAIGVLFGNAFRLKPLNARSSFFTEKVLSSAKRTGARLIRTPDLFRAVWAIRTGNNKDLAAACRKAIQEQAGKVVQFPVQLEGFQVSSSETENAATLVDTNED